MQIEFWLLSARPEASPGAWATAMFEGDELPRPALGDDLIPHPTAALSRAVAASGFSARQGQDAGGDCPGDGQGVARASGRRRAQGRFRPGGLANWPPPKPIRR